eukprot:jgi/Orpsp1_1/1189925/evm.model.d7180000075497.1
MERLFHNANDFNQEAPLLNPENDADSDISDASMNIRDEKIRSPARFYGTRDSVEAYIAHCRSNFVNYPPQFPDMRREVQYLLNNMGGEAYEWGSKLLEKFPEKRNDSEWFISKIRNTFGDPDLEFYHQKQFRELHQKGIGNAIDYVNEFRRLSVFIDTDEDLLINNLYNGLEPQLKERIDVVFPPPDNIDEYCRLIVRLDRHLAASMRSSRDSRNRSNSSQHSLNRNRSHNRNNNDSNHNNNNNKSPVRCSACHRLGHSEDRCYRKHPELRNSNNKVSTIFRKSSNSPVFQFDMKFNGYHEIISLLVDTGAFACFLDKSFVDLVGIPYNSRNKLTDVQGLGGSLPVYGQTDELEIRHGEHFCKCKFYIIDLEDYEGILGYDWFQTHQPTIISQENQLEFNSEFCKDHCYHVSNQRVSAIDLPSKEQEEIQIPKELEDLKEVFEEKQCQELPPHREYDCSIDLKPNATPYYGPLYSLTEKEQEVLREELNKNTIRNSYPLPLIKDLLDRVQGSSYFSKLDLPGAYNLIRIKEGDQFKTAFRTRFGHYEYEVMPFGLTNAPATFQHFLNDILAPVLDEFAFAYIDDILIFSKTFEEHVDHVRQVLNILLKNKLFCKLKKCEFFKNSVDFLGYVLSDKGISMCTDKLNAIQDWPKPTNVNEVQQFLGLANFYRRFIKNFAELAHPLTKLTRKNIAFEWKEEQEKAFKDMKEAFCSAPVLSIPVPSRRFIVETDASNFAIGSVLSQYDENNVLHPCAYMSKSLSDTQLRYTNLRKEILEQYHSKSTAGHLGFDKTKELITRYFYWPKMRNDIYLWTKKCTICATMKNSTHAPYGLVQQSDTPERPWDIVSVDFITDLPCSNNYTTIVNIVDNFSKMIHLVPFSGLPNAEDTANIFLSHVFKLHGLPSIIVSDQGTQFTS